MDGVTLHQAEQHDKEAVTKALMSDMDGVTLHQAQTHAKAAVTKVLAELESKWTLPPTGLKEALAGMLDIPPTALAAEMAKEMLHALLRDREIVKFISGYLIQGIVDELEWRDMHRRAPEETKMLLELATYRHGLNGAKSFRVNGKAK